MALNNEIKINADTPSIKVPMFFSLEKNGKTSYLLLTNHVLSTMELPHQCLKIISTCQSYVTEESDQDAQEFYGKAIFRDKDSPDWAPKLSAETAQSLQTAINETSKMIGIPPPKLGDLECWAAHYLAEYGYRTMIVDAASTDNKVKADIPVEFEDTNNDVGAETNAGTDPSSSSNPAYGMDLELIQSFKKTYGLETLCSNIPLHKQNGNSVADLQKLYNEMLEAMTEIKVGEEESPNNDAESLDSILDDYRFGQRLVRPEFADEQNQDLETIHRNFNWLPAFFHLHHNAEGPVLFGVGARHGIGECGLLSLLPKFGFTLKRLGSNGIFEDYIYPFQSHRVSDLALQYERITVAWSRKLQAEAIVDHFAPLTRQYELQMQNKQKQKPSCKEQTHTVQSSLTVKVNHGWGHVGVGF